VRLKIPKLKTELASRLSGERNPLSRHAQARVGVSFLTMVRPLTRGIPDPQPEERGGGGFSPTAAHFEKKTMPVRVAHLPPSQLSATGREVRPD